MSPDAFGNLLVVFGVLGGLGVLGLFVASLARVYADAQARRKTGCLWLLIAFFTWPLGAIAYAVLRDRTVQL